MEVLVSRSEAREAVYNSPELLNRAVTLVTNPNGNGTIYNETLSLILLICAYLNRYQSICDARSNAK
jgi:hypothetical protein